MRHIDASKPLWDLLDEIGHLWDQKVEEEVPFDEHIREVYPNEKEGVVVVIFQDMRKEIIHCVKGDHFDVNVGVALAIAQHLYGSKTQFHKVVERNTHIKKEKEEKAEPKTAKTKTIKKTTRRKKESKK